MNSEMDVFRVREEASFFTKHLKIIIFIATILSIILLITLITTISSNNKNNSTESNNLDTNQSQLPILPKQTPSSINEFNLNLEYFPETSNTKCLDGSPYGIYFGRGQAAGANKVVINFWGGAWCTGRDKASFLSSCTTRSNTEYGSSKLFKAKYNYEYDFFGKEESKNKFFYNWNKLDIPYCDGTGTQGHISDPLIINNNAKLYFRGYDNTLAALDYLFSKVKINEIDTVVVSGCSSGGFSAIYWLQYIADLVAEKNPNAAVLGISSGGLFMDYKNIKTNDNDFGLRMKQMYEMVNQEIPMVNKDCLKDHKENPHQCLLHETLIKYIKAPLLLFEAAYDGWAIKNILGETCHDTDYTLRNCDEQQINSINQMKDYNKGVLVEAAKTKKNLSVWSPACIFHCFLNILRDSRSFSVDGKTINEVIWEFLDSKGQKQILLFDKFENPENRQCN